jgi:hypothetical protein
MTIDPYRSPGLTFATTEEKVREELQAIQDRLDGGELNPKPARLTIVDQVRHARQQLGLAQEYPGRDKS